MGNRRLLDEMFRAGYVSATEAASLALVSANGTIYRAINAGRLEAVRSGVLWFVTLKSLLALYGQNPVIAKRIREWRPSTEKPKRPARRRAA
jgi:hypothetical protein